MKKLLLRKRNLLLFLAPLGLLLTYWAKSSTEAAEKIFATGIYKILSQGMSLLTGWIPFSLMEFIIIVGPITVLILIIRQIIRIVRVKKTACRKEKGYGDIIKEYSGTMENQSANVQNIAIERLTLLITMLQNLLCLAAVIYFGYVLLCGVNYHRYPVSYHLGLTVEKSTEDELAGLYVELVDKAVELRAQLTTENEQGAYVLPHSERQLGKEAKKAYQEFAKEYPVFGGLYPAPKHVFFSHLMSWTEITGVFTPWTMEANVNIDISPYSIGSTMCHELAHLRGFMREDEANYISYRVCVASDSIDLQYSGTMLALIHTGNALYRQNADRYFELYQTHMSHEVSVDLVANNEYWDQFEKPVVGETTVGEIANKVNDAYLKANDQEDGTKSYGRVVDLLLAEYKQRKSYFPAELPQKNQWESKDSPFIFMKIML